MAGPSPGQINVSVAIKFQAEMKNFGARNNQYSVNLRTGIAPYGYSRKKILVRDQRRRDAQTPPTGNAAPSVELFCASAIL